MSTRLKHGRVLSGKDMSKQSRSWGLDWTIFIPVVGLSLFGLLMIYDASVVVSMSRYGHNFHYVTQQAISLGVGLLGMIALSRVPYQYWLKLSPIILLFGFVLLFTVFIPGLGVSLGGAQSWLKIGPIQFQPSYPLTIALILYLSQWLPSPKTDLNSVRNGLMPFLAVLGFIVFIVAVPQGDLGTAILISLVSLTMYFLAGAPWRHLLTLLPIGATVATLMVIIQPYRLQRITSYLGGGSADAQNADWQVDQLLIALGSGGLTGVGLGQSRQKYDWLPVVESDSIFAIIGEELGYVGALAVVVVFAYLVWSGFSLSQKAPDQEGRLLVVGVTSFIAIQAAVNLMAAVSLIPLTGVPLPFISSGGTSLMVLLLALGIVLNVSRQANIQR